MNIIDFEEEEKKRVVMEYPKFRLIQGGKEPPANDNYWLGNLYENGVFIARRKKGEDRWIASEYHIRIKIGNAFMIKLVQWDPEKQKERYHFTWISGPHFCEDWDCVEVLDDGKSYRTDNEGGLEDSKDIIDGGRGSNSLDQETGQENVPGELDNKSIDLK